MPWPSGGGSSSEGGVDGVGGGAGGLAGGLGGVVFVGSGPVEVEQAAASKSETRSVARMKFPLALVAIESVDVANDVASALLVPRARNAQNTEPRASMTPRPCKAMPISVSTLRSVQ